MDDSVDERSTTRRAPASTWSGAVLGAIVTIAIGALIAQNTTEVSVRWLFASGKQPLWLVLAIAAMAGVLANKLFGFAWRHRHHRSEREHRYGGA